MGYVKNTWKTGDTITAEKLNTMENGIEAANKRLIFSVIEDEENQNEETTYHAVDENGDPISFAELWEAYNNDIEVVCSIDGALVAPTYFSEDEFYIAVPGEVGENGISMVIIWGSTDDGTDQWDMRFQGFHLGLPDPDHQAGKIVGVDNNYEFTLIDPPSGGGSRFVVYIVEDDSEENENENEDPTYHAEDADGHILPIVDIVTAYTEGAEVVLNFDGSIWNINYIDESSLMACIPVEMKNHFQDFITIEGYTSHDVDNWNVYDYFYEIPELPDIHYTDEGKVLGVDSNGDWALVEQSGGGALTDDEMKTVLLDADLFDVVCVVEEEGGVQVQKILSDESDNILIW